MDFRMACMMFFAVVMGAAGHEPEGNLRGMNDSRTESAKALLGGNASWRLPIPEVTNFTDYIRNSLNVFQLALNSAIGGPSVNSPNGTLANNSQNASREDLKYRSCLCIFDVDRTLTGRQGDTRSCPGNRVVSGSYDDAYGGGSLTLSQLGQNLWHTFCGSCHVRAITAHPHRRPNLPISESVVGCNEGCKAYHAGRMASELGIAKSEVYMFDDKASNINPFRGTGMNAHQVSCGSREGGHGLCGATLGEIQKAKGVTTC